VYKTVKYIEIASIENTAVKSDIYVTSDSLIIVDTNYISGATKDEISISNDIIISELQKLITTYYYKVIFTKVIMLNKDFKIKYVKT